jgi:hypothetical protein
VRPAHSLTPALTRLRRIRKLDRRGHDHRLYCFIVHDADRSITGIPKRYSATHEPSHGFGRLQNAIFSDSFSLRSWLAKLHPEFARFPIFCCNIFSIEQCALNK